MVFMLLGLLFLKTMKNKKPAATSHESNASYVSPDDAFDSEALLRGPFFVFHRQKKELTA